MIFASNIPEPIRRELTEALSTTVRTLADSGVRLVFPESIDAGQRVWPEQCPLSEPELRAEVQAILDRAKALEVEVRTLKEHAGKIYARLPKIPPAEIEGELPRGIYYALADCLSFIIDKDGLRGYFDFSYIEDGLTATPASMRTEWLEQHMERCLGWRKSVETGDPLEELLAALGTEEVRNVEDSAAESRGRVSAGEPMKKIGRGTLTLEDLSFVLDTDSSMPDEVQDRVRQDILGDPRYAELFEHAEQIRRDAGVAELWEAMVYGVRFEKLLAAEDWDDPAEILMPGEKDTSCLGHRELIRIAEARISRGEHPDRLLALKERVARAECKLPETVLAELVGLVRGLSPESAARMVARSSALLEQASTPTP